MVYYNIIFTGEFGIVYKGVLIDWNNVPIQGVAVKTLKSNIIYYMYVVHRK